MSETSPPQKKDPLELASNRVALIAGIIAAILAVNTGLNNCHNESIAKVAAFRQAVTAEEAYWKSLYDDYFSTFTADFDSRAEMRNAKLYAIAQAASHAVPDFHEFDVPESSKNAAMQRLASLQSNLQTSLRAPSATGETVSKKLAIQDEVATARSDAREATSSAAAPAGTTTPAAVAEAKVVAAQIANPLAVQSLATQTLSVGKADGWDIDVFWCHTSSENGAYLTANAVASALAEKSKAGVAIAPGIVLGRIRLRPLLEDTNQKPGYQIHGNVVRADGGETREATAVREFINAAQPVPFTLSDASQITRFYLSVFACGS